MDKKELMEMQAQAIKEAALFQLMTKEARERFRRVEMVHPDNAHQALMTILQQAQLGRLKEVDDEALKSILNNINSKKDYKIIRK
jgi:DNA-binding TFAR19-related protein (PDSD5 family)